MRTPHGTDHMAVDIQGCDCDHAVGHSRTDAYIMPIGAGMSSLSATAFWASSSDP